MWILQELNLRFSKKLRELLASEPESEVDDAALISIDSKGVDIRVRQGAQVLIFPSQRFLYLKILPSAFNRKYVDNFLFVKV